MADKRMFLQLMSATAGVLGREELKLYDGLLDQWWGKVRGKQRVVLRSN
jgi:hypothetical protein